MCYIWVVINEAGYLSTNLQKILANQWFFNVKSGSIREIAMKTIKKIHS